MSITRRQFLLGTGAGLILPSYYDMEKRKHDFVRFDAIHNRDYNYAGSNEFRFNERKTVIIGDNGSGKSALFNALAMRGPELTVRSNLQSNSRFPLVQVMTTGDRELITQYRQLIFVDEESVDANRVLHHFGRGHGATDLENITWNIFERLVGSYHRKSTALADRQSWAMGEWTCYGYARIFAARSMLNVDLPLVLDAPFGRLEREPRQELADYLDEIDGQQILFISTIQAQGFQADYRLPNRVLPFRKS